MDGSAKSISETDVDAIRQKIANCQEMAHSIRGKCWQLNERDSKKEKESAERTEAGDVAGEFKQKLSDVHDLLCDAFNSLSAFV